MPTRRLSAPMRLLLAMLLVAALAVRALVPAGWMPGATPTGAATLVLCSGSVAADPPPTAMPGMHHGQRGDPTHPAPEHPCAFTGLGLAWTPALLPAIVLPPAVAPARPRGDGGTVAIGRGLAAPPPPATGPPILA